MITTERLRSRGYALGAVEWCAKRRSWVQVWTKREELPGKPWTGPYGPECHALIHHVYTQQGEVVGTASWRGYHNQQDGSWWIAANVPAVLSMEMAP